MEKFMIFQGLIFILDLIIFMSVSYYMAYKTTSPKTYRTVPGLRGYFNIFTIMLVTPECTRDILG